MSLGKTARGKDYIGKTYYLLVLVLWPDNCPKLLWLTLAHSWRLQAIMVGEARQQGHEPAGHSMYSQEAERGCWPSAPLLLFFFVCTHLPQQPLEDNFESWCSPSLMRVLQTSLRSSDMVASTFTCRAVAFLFHSVLDSISMKWYPQIWLGLPTTKVNLI